MAEKIAFIICCNNEEYLEECIYYIQALDVPNGYETELLVIREASSMTSAYNEAMQSSDAKYKIYLHQDTFLIKNDMIIKILEIFQDETIGMMGVIGGTKLPKSGSASYAWNCGNVFLHNEEEICQINGWSLEGDDNLIDVDAIDGMLMITQHDIPWVEDVFDGFHFYDVSQSLEFKRNGYRVVVARDDDAWALHDTRLCGVDRYDEYRKRFCDKYAEFGLVYDSKDDTIYNHIKEDIERLESEINQLAENGSLPEMQEKLQEYFEKNYRSGNTFCARKFLKIIEQEIAEGGESKTSALSWREFLEVAQHVRWMLWRYEFKMDTDAISTVAGYIRNGAISIKFIQNIIETGIWDKGKVWNGILSYVKQ